MTQNVMIAFFSQEGAALDFSGVHLPADDLWEIVAERVIGYTPAPGTSRKQAFVEISILIGSRWPDTRGHAVTSLDALYAAHGDTADQHEHCLRSPGHRWDAGNDDALREIRSFIRQRVHWAMEYRRRPATAQLVTVNEYVELYGTVPLRLHGPSFFLGTAIHTLQDCFSHTLRSDDLHHIRQVLNFVAAVTPDYRESRDGLPHSHVMDNCDDRRTIPIQLAAEQAVRQLMAVLSAKSEAEIDAIIDQVMADWMVRETGCDITTNYCDSKWLDLVREGPVLPLSSCSLTTVAGNRSVSLFHLLMGLW